MNNLAITTIDGQPFNGEITDEIRAKLRRKRYELCATTCQLQRVLGISRYTIRKWESGDSRKCKIGNVYILANFLSGKYDDQIRRLVRRFDVHLPSWNNMPPAICKCIERFMTVYTLAPDRNVKGQLQREVNQVLESTTNSLLRLNLPPEK